MAAESKTTWHWFQTLRLRRRRPLAPPSSNWAEVRVKRGSTAALASSFYTHTNTHTYGGWVMRVIVRI
jgi:hypothetical protein